MLVTMAALLVVFGAVLVHGQRMLLGRSDVDVDTGSRSPAVMVPLVGGLILAAGLGLWLGPLRPLIESAVSVVSP
jgi:hypothetical protein